MAAYNGDIKLKVDLDIDPAKKTANSLQSVINKALSSASPKVQNTGVQLQKAADKANKLNVQLERMENTRLTSQPFVNLQNELANVDKEISKVKTSMENMVQSGKHQTVSTEYTKLLEDEKWLLEQLEPLQKKHADYQALGFTDKQLSSHEWFKEYQALSQELRDVRGEMEAVRDLNQQFAKTSQYTEKEQQLAALSQLYDEIVAKMQAMQQEGTDTISQAEMNPEKYAEVARQAGYANAAVGILANTIHQATSHTDLLKKAWQRLKSSITSAVSRISHALGTLKDKLSRLVSHTETSHNKSFKKMLNMVLKYGLGVRSLFLLYRKLRNTMKTGLTELSNQSTQVANDLAMLKTSWSGFKAGLVSAFQPIFSYVVPALSTLINYLTSAMNALANFFAVLTGQGFYYKAKIGNASAAKAISNTGSAAADASKKLAEYDDLLVIDDDKSGGGGGAGGGAGDSAWEQAETTPSKWAEMLKEAFKTWDFTEVGEYIGKKLTDALNSIDWDKVYQTAQNFGKGLATFLNGLISPELFGALGTTIANAITTALIFLRTFGETFDWKDFGNSVKTGIQKFVEHSPLKLAAETFNVWAHGILDALIECVQGLLDDGVIKQIAQDIANAIETIDVKGVTWKLGKLANSLANALYELVSNKETWNNLGTKIADGINGFFSSMNKKNPATGLNGWEASAKTISNLATGILEMFIKAINKVKWKEVGKAISDFFSSIEWGQLAKDVSEITVGIFKALTDAIKGVNWEKVGQSIADFLKNIEWGKLAWNLVKLAWAIVNGLVDALWGLITDSDLTTKIGLAIGGIILACKISGKSLGLADKATSFISSSLGLDSKGTFGFNLNTLAIAIGTMVILESDKIGNWFGKKIAELIGADSETLSYYEEYDSWEKIFPELKRALEEGNFWDGFGQLAADAGKGFLSLFGIEFTDDDRDQMEQYGKDAYNALWAGVNKAKQGDVEGEEPNYDKVWFEFDENGGIRYAYQTNKKQFKWTPMKGVTYEKDQNGNINYAYQNKNQYKSANLDTYSKLELEITAKYNKGEISLEGLNEYMDALDRAYSYAKKHNMRLETLLGGDIDSVEEFQLFLDQFDILGREFVDRDADLNLDVTGDTDDIQDVKKLGDSIINVRDNWKNKNATMTLDTNVEGGKNNGNFLLSNLGSTFKEKLYDIWQGKKALFEANTSGTESAKSAIQGVKDVWKGTTADFEITWHGGQATKDAVNEVGNLFNSWNGTTATFEMAIGMSSSGITNIANDVIKKINDQLSAVGWFKNFKASPIPYINGDNRTATGGVVTAAQMRLVGEAGAEAIVPLENNLGWLNKMATMITDEMIATNRLPDITKGYVLPTSETFMKATAGSEDTTTALLQEIATRLDNRNNEPIVLQLNGRTVAQVVWDESAKRYKQTGISYA